MTSPIDWRELKALDAGLRFREHPFARLDDENLAKMIESPLKAMCTATKRAWMVEANYANFPLRDREGIQQIWCINKDEDKFEILANTASGDRFIIRHDLVISRPAMPNAWLTWTREELASEATEYGISFEDAFRLAIHSPNSSEQAFEWDEAFGASRPFKGEGRRQSR